MSAISETVFANKIHSCIRQIKALIILFLFNLKTQSQTIKHFQCSVNVSIRKPKYRYKLRKPIRRLLQRKVANFVYDTLLCKTNTKYYRDC